MSALGQAWIAAARARLRFRRDASFQARRTELIRRYAPGRSWADVGCMWSVHGGLAFLAEESGATEVTGVDVMAPTPEYEAEHARRGSRMRFVRGDLHDPEAVREVGLHDVVWSTGLIYHAPHPLLTIERLGEVARELLILGSATIPEVPGIPQACVFYPALGPRERRVFRRAGGGERLGITTPFDADRSYGNWYWGLTPSALQGMVRAAGLEIVETVAQPFDVILVARRR